MPAEAGFGFGGCYVSIITLENHKNNIKLNRGVLLNHDISLVGACEASLVRAEATKPVFWCLVRPTRKNQQS
jgi:hypothetical protein